MRYDLFSCVSNGHGETGQRRQIEYSNKIQLAPLKSMTKVNLYNDLNTGRCIEKDKDT